MLTGSEIKKRLGKDIIIEPFNEEQLNPNSYNIRLHNELLVYETDFFVDGGRRVLLDMKKENPTKKIIIPESGLELKPNRLYLGRTVEYTETYNLIPCIDGRSSIGRLGINVEISAGFGDIGFKGTWTLEIRCVEPVIIYPFIEIGQLYYQVPVGDIDIQYNGRYQGQKDATASRLFMTE